MTYFETDAMKWSDLELRAYKHSQTKYKLRHRGIYLEFRTLVTTILLGLLLLTVFPSKSLIITSVFCSSFEPLNFSIVILPDTQHYSQNHPEIFDNQTQWIVNNVEEMNIIFVTHEGDIVDAELNIGQWERADNSLTLLDGIVPWAVLPG